MEEPGGQRLNKVVKVSIPSDVIHDQDITGVSVTPVRCDKKGTFSPETLGPSLIMKSLQNKPKRRACCKIAQQYYQKYPRKTYKLLQTEIKDTVKYNTMPWIRS